MKLKTRGVRIVVVIGLIMFFGNVFAQKVSRVEPPNWWAGMNNPNLQIMLYGENLKGASVTIDAEGVDLVRINEAESPNYMFLDLKIGKEAPSQTFDIKIKSKSGKMKVSYELKTRSEKTSETVDASDVVYLLTPDRFANGDPSNDTVKGMKEVADRSFRGGRHGGDLTGVLSKLDYLDDLGITAIWLNPVVENDMPKYSYHGYAITDYYKVDPRYGSNEQYVELANELHARDMKLVIDLVFNHCGLSHWWMVDMPYSDWVHDHDTYGNSNYQLAVESDPYSSTSDLNKMEKGWFVPTMPDLNQDNPMMANYLIQNSIWWIEYAHLDGIRMDTHPYNSKEVMKQWTERVHEEYPGFYLLGETWVGDPALEAYWAPKATNPNGFESGLTSITDFPICYAMHNAFKEDGDVWRLYETLGKDFLYKEPMTNTIFPDNHDMDRFYHTIGNDVNRFNTAMTFTMTTRGIPQLFYGTEILMEKFGDHGDLREDFPGGWEGDSQNAFDFEELTETQRIAFDHLRKLLNYRKESKALQYGTLKHFMPNDNVYVYNRMYEDENVLVILSNNDAEVELDLVRFKEILEGYEGGLNVMTGESVILKDSLLVAPESSLIIELSKK
ncbi:MAG: alpha-amlyase [Flammeovirgaceae bacterium]|nr:alpha-amlyase [Flammeovirgaceae bacterium]MBE61764.1 alpha-amlyase [Flammeovirgaceae bacterium]HCX23233.1 alpha-amlyase [Cytophagales bacterium]|tara:strand:- start:1056 stop:2894 length:1839 start_codon:yes stop_codon:yes gene_type:complete